MAKKEFMYRGKKFDELIKMTPEEFAGLLPAREARTIRRGFTEAQKTFLEKLRTKNTVETHCRDMIILPEMVGKRIKIHRGNRFMDITILEEMIGHRLGEFALTRNNVKHSAPGIGATRSTSSLSVK